MRSDNMALYRDLTLYNFVTHIGYRNENILI